MPQRDLLPLEMIGLLSGDPVIGKAVTAGRGKTGGARKSIGQGFFYDPETDEVKRDETYADWEKKRRADNLSEEKKRIEAARVAEQARFDRGQRAPDYYTQETPEGLTVHDINPLSVDEGQRPAPQAYPMRPDRPPAAQAVTAAKLERAVENLENLYRNLPPGVGDFSKELHVKGAEMVAPEALESLARNYMVGKMYTEEEEDAVRTLSRNFATTVKEFAGAAQTPTEIKNVEKFLPTPGMSHYQVLASIEEFIKYAKETSESIRDPYGRTAAPTTQQQQPNVSSQSEQALEQRYQELMQKREQ